MPSLHEVSIVGIVLDFRIVDSRDFLTVLALAMSDFRPIGIKLKRRAVFMIVTGRTLCFSSPRRLDRRGLIVTGRWAVATFAAYIDSIQSGPNCFETTCFSVTCRVA